MTLQKQQYVRKPNRLEVVELTRENLGEAATWCGARINDIRDPSSIGVPSLYGAIDAEVGSFITKELETGRFLIMTKEHLDAEYSRVGRRQDGFVNRGFPKLGGN
jgi:hypothetical protein